MLIHSMAERVRGLGLAAMADAFLDMHNQSAADDLGNCNYPVTKAGNCRHWNRSGTAARGLPKNVFHEKPPFMDRH